ncbi:MAG TPA: CDP-diacylglycerol--serine O-phosphatidyltransferase [Steroidobacteraceae bacterium]|nr:CDP-diacylglycerol--serine O-phosphatidyltransferase [Steroidobacteraceae bacterium]
MTPDTPTPQLSSKDSADNPPRRGIYLLPNLLTTGCLFSGFYSIVAAVDTNFAFAGAAVFIALLFDGLDGRVARWTRTESPFGKEYDSLADMVAFGVAPAVLVYQWGVIRISEYGDKWRQFGWVIAFFYCACAALRLARFNTRAAAGDKRYFEGLPSPSAAATVAAFVWFFSKWREPGLPGLILAFAVTGYAAMLMVSPFSYISMKQIDVDKRVKYSYFGFVILPMLALVFVDPPTMLFAMFVSYASYGPVQWLVRKLRRPRSGAA